MSGARCAGGGSSGSTERCDGSGGAVEAGGCHASDGESDGESDGDGDGDGDRVEAGGRHASDGDGVEAEAGVGVETLIAPPPKQWVDHPPIF